VLPRIQARVVTQSAGFLLRMISTDDLDQSR
jgi:hypothetical protein